MQRNTPPTRAGTGSPSNGSSRPSTNNDASASLLSRSLKRMSLNTAPGTTTLSHSPRPPSDVYGRISSSPAFPRSPSVASLSRSSSPAPGLRKKSSTASLRGDMSSASPRLPGSRRGSFIPNTASPTVPKSSSPLVPQMDERPPPLRACDIADEYFKKELALHEGLAGSANAGTIVIIHDQCYGHRFARPKTNKGTLMTIMERPERILASVRGISAAYVRLGDRHSEGANAPQPNKSPSDRIPFKIRKTARIVDLTSPIVTNVHGTKWMEEFKSLCENAGEKLTSTGKELARDPPTIPGQPSKPAFHPMDLYLCAESLNAIQGALGGVVEAVDAVFQGNTMENGVSRAFVCIRPPGHHCSAEWPSGFCWVNNVHVGIEHAIANYGLTHAAIIDFDLHHGDGSQDITWERNKKVQAMHRNTPNWKKTSIGYFSLHDINSFPCEGGDDDKVQAASLCIDNAHGQSVWNIHLETWSTPEEFWQIYEEKYMVLIEKTRKYLKLHTNRLRKSPNHPAPKAAIFLSAGFDASEHETAGMQRHTVNVPTEFYARFTRDVVRLSEEADTGVNGRVISVLEGGYSDRALASGVMSHISGLCDGQVWTDPTPASEGIAFQMQKRMSNLSVYDGDSLPSPTPSEPTLVTYEPSWWHVTRLAELENMVTPLPYVAPKKVRTGPSAHFSSPTQSFTAKVVDPSKMSRSLSGRYSSTSPSRAPTPPPPEVDWATATQSLCRLLIPSDRQTRSHKPEELAEPKVKKEKPAPVLSSVRMDPSGRQLRGRKAAAYVEPGSEDESASVRAESRASRRQTIADVSLPSTESAEPKRVQSRRVSMASTMSSAAPERSVSRASTIVPPSRRGATSALGTNGAPIKKARATTTAASRIPKNAPPVPSVPSTAQHQAKPASPKEEKENEMDQLTSGLQRVTLRMPSKEDHDAREKKRMEAELAEKAEKKPRVVARKSAVPRAPKAATKAAAPKKPVGRPPKSSKPSSPVQPVTANTAPDPPQLQPAAAVERQEPVPVEVDHIAGVLEQAASPVPTPEVKDAPAFTTSPINIDRRQSSGIEPPSNVVEMKMFSEQLPKPTFVTNNSHFGKLTTSPPRPDTPPPPPPNMMPEFVQSFGVTSPLDSPPLPTAPVPAEKQEQAPMAPPSQWMTTQPVPKMNTEINIPSPSVPNPLRRPVSAAGKRGEMPVFSANGVIPFASSNGETVSAGPPTVTTAPKVEEGKYKDIWEIPDTPAR